MLKNGQLYGSIIPPEVNSLRIRDISLGEKVSLQLIALTEHPVGKIDRRTEQLEKEVQESGGTLCFHGNICVFGFLHIGVTCSLCLLH